MKSKILILVFYYLSFGCSAGTTDTTNCYSLYNESKDKELLECATRYIEGKVKEEGGEESKLHLSRFYYESGDILKFIELNEQLIKEFQSADAAYNLAQIYYSGNDVVEKDYSKVVKLLELASDRGLAVAQLELSYMYSTHLEEKNYKKALNYLHSAANNNSKGEHGYAAEAVIKAQLILGKVYKDGSWGQKINLEKAEYWFSKASYNLGNIEYGTKGK